MAQWDRWNKSNSESSGTYYYDENGNRSSYSPEDYAYKTVMRGGRPKTMGWSLASLILGIASVSSGLFGWSGVIFGILAIVFSLLAKRNLGYFDGMAVAGIVLGIFGLVFAIGILIAVEIIPAEYFEEFFETIPSDSSTTNPGGI